RNPNRHRPDHRDRNRPSNHLPDDRACPRSGSSHLVHNSTPDSRHRSARNNHHNEHPGDLRNNRPRSARSKLRSTPHKGTNGEYSQHRGPSHSKGRTPTTHRGRAPANPASPNPHPTRPGQRSQPPRHNRPSGISRLAGGQRNSSNHPAHDHSHNRHRATPPNENN